MNILKQIQYDQNWYLTKTGRIRVEPISYYLVKEKHKIEISGKFWKMGRHNIYQVTAPV